MDIQQLPKAQYPFLLNQISRLPAKLDVAGILPSETNRFLCVVGPRLHSSYGREACQKIVSGLKGHPIVIVSGLAIGIDSIAHEAALDAGLITIGFPGSGLSERVLYPVAHRALAKRIVESGGALLSPFNFEQEATQWTFPNRNRLMAGISHATLVIEGEKDSGTLITAGCAGEFNRDLMAVPGSIFSALSYGPHQLLRKGGIAVTCSEDVLEVLGFEIERNEYGDPVRTEKLNLDELDLSPLERRIVDRIHVPKDRDNLIRELGIPISEANAILVSLELRNIIVENGTSIRRA
jgi:DNA processing protein